MDPRFSLKIYPRKDVVYKGKASLDFAAIGAKVYMDRKKGKCEGFNRWLIHGIIGIVVGTIAFAMGFAEENLANFHARYTQKLLNEGYVVGAVYGFWVGFSICMAFLAAFVTVMIGPYAAGSGVPEVMGLLNGVNYHGAIDVLTLFSKVVGVVLAVVANLCVGKEGPLVHIGAIVGTMIPYIPLDDFKCFRNDSDKRTFMAAGSSAGVAAAFGAPIGGALFTYEISKPNTFWSFSMLWRVFFTAAISTFTLGFW